MTVLQEATNLVRETKGDEIDLERDGEPRRLRVVRIDLPDPAGGSVGRLVLLDDITELDFNRRLVGYLVILFFVITFVPVPMRPLL